MKRLTLIRHAKSSWKDSKLDDFDRPPNGRGLRDAPVMAARLAESAPHPERIVSSPARRAAFTAEAAAEALGIAPEAIVWERALYLADAPTLADVVCHCEDAIRHLAIVGHNPGLTQLVEWLADAGIDNVPTSGIVRLGLAVQSWGDVVAGCGELLDFDYPKREPR